MHAYKIHICMHTYVCRESEREREREREDMKQKKTTELSRPEK
jgi:hypothetical protein